MEDKFDFGYKNSLSIYIQFEKIFWNENYLKKKTMKIVTAHSAEVSS